MKFKIGNLEGVPVKQNKNNGGRYSGGRVAVAIFNGTKFMAELNGKRIPIKLTLDLYLKADIIFSNHLNTAYPIWTPKKCSKLEAGVPNRYQCWSLLRNKQKIAGNIIDDEFVLDMDYVNKQNNKYYETCSNRL